MKYLGIDYGEKRVGIAISDAEGKLAFPHKVLVNGEKLIEEILKISKEQGIEKIIVGDSKDFKGENNKIMEKILPFVQNLKSKTNLEVLMHPEFLTSQEARRLQGKNDMLDASAAALILKSYLDTHDNN